MRAPSRISIRASHGFSRVELLAFAAMGVFAVGFLIVHFVQGDKNDPRVTSSIELANHLQRARLDSMKRNASDVEEMAQVKMFNRNLYSVAIDADGDNQLDIPLVISLPADQTLQLDGQFPNTYIFNESGQTVDENKHPVSSPSITLTNNKGASEITFSESGDISVVATLKKRS